ncbi:IPT/TIG domain-containing protein [Janthinobacterium agaricidamnosum]|nr:IPT/TIG domain-containing protein [Janthinobacterium agaricidamnosum]
MPSAPVSGLLALVSGSGTSNTVFQLNAYVPLAVTDVSPATGGAGSTVTVTGSGLSALTSVQFANSSSATVASPHGDSSVSFVVPAGAASGNLTFIGTYNQFTTSSPYTVLPVATVSSLSSQASGNALSITVLGTNLGSVTGAKVGAATASIVSASDTQLVLSAALGSTGNVVLSAPSRIDVNAGTISVFNIGSIDFDQVYNVNASDAALKLSQGKPAAVRAAVLTNTGAGRASPLVTLEASSKTGILLGRLTMSGPATLPLSKDDYALSTTFNTVLPAAWVQPGLQVKIIAAQSDGSAAISQSATPAVANAAKIRVVLVPLISATGTSQVPDMGKIRDALARVYPYAAADITVTQRAPLQVAGSSRDNSWWEATLSQLESVRKQEDTGAFYYGLASDPSTTRTAGLAYIGDRASGTAWSSAVGLDARWTFQVSTDPFGNAWPEWLTTLVHEIGHNHSLLHVDCGSPAGVDPAYPYPNGNLGSKGIYNSLYGDTQLGQLSKPANNANGTSTQMKDVMSYCGGSWFSDYSYARVQQFLSNRSVANAQASLLAASVLVPENGFLTISGKITASGVQLNAPVASGARLQAEVMSNSHHYTLRVTTGAGQTIDVPFNAASLADHGGEMSHFWVSLVNPGDISDLQVFDQDKALPQLGQRKVSKTDAANVSTSLANGKLSLTWNAAAEPNVAVSYVAANGSRSVLASSLSGGSATLDVRSLAGGGTFEVSLATALKARLVRVPNQ